MKTFTKKLMAALTLCAVLAGQATAEDAEAKAQDADAPKAYAEKMPDNDKLEVLAEHKFIATFEAVKFHTCMGRTGGCPDKCGSSGNIANFKITDYLHYKKLGKYGHDQSEAYSIQISDFHRKPQGDPALLAIIETLEKGDQVVIEWKHLYGEVSPVLTSSVAPLLLFKKIDKEEAKQLIDKAAAAERAEQASRERGQHLTQEAFLKRLRELDPKQFKNTKPEELAKRTKLRLDDRRLSDDDFRCLVKWMPALEHLHLRSCDFPKDSLEHLTGLKDLTTLSLEYAQLKDEDMVILAKLKGLKSLDLCSADITDKGLEALAGLTQLQRLSLKACPFVKGPGLRHLVPLKHLKELGLGRISRGDGLEDAGFDHLGKMAALEKLSLRHCEKFSPGSLDKLTGLTNLKAIDFSYAFTYRDDKAGVQPALGRLQAALPDCKLIVSKRFEKERKRLQ